MADDKQQSGDKQKPDGKQQSDDKAPATRPKKAPSKPAAPTPMQEAVGSLEKVVESFTNGFHVKDIERDLLRELKAVGITRLEDLQGHRLKDIRQALDQTLRASAHRLLGAAEPLRSKEQ